MVSFNTPESFAPSAGPAFRLESRLYEVGPAVEIGLPRGISVEFDALYHRQGFFTRSATIRNIGPTESATIAGNFRFFSNTSCDGSPLIRSWKQESCRER